jgi:hypothetical protein
MNTLRRSSIIGLLVLLASSGAQAASLVGPVGGTRDAHGCLPAAGYTWCARIRQCVRPWEFAAKKGIANTPAAFERACRARKTRG